MNSQIHARALSHSNAPAADIASDFEAIIRSPSFPCVGAKSALALGCLRTVEAGPFSSDQSDVKLHKAICSFGAEATNAAGMATLAALFSEGQNFDELTFERLLWSRLQALHQLDVAHGIPWSPHASCDPEAADFAISVGGHAYFVVGLHPGASRAARRFPRPALVFNLHAQFEQMKRDGRYDLMQQIIRARDLEQNGSINPMLADFGVRSEAAQYSGRAIEPGWTCPFSPQR